MFAINSILPPAHIFVGVEWQSKKRVFEQVGSAFEESAGVPRDKIFTALMHRERLGSTFIGNSGAIPHGQISETKTPLCALALLKRPVQYGGGGDENTVRTLFFLIAPHGGEQSHLWLLGLFSEILSDVAFVDKLHAAPDSETVYTMLQEWKNSLKALNEADLVSTKENNG
ncbi:MAG: PTS sugar transporter subunit IIA [Gammaproteobacteria bacterium WSBS_2016_MAG_OTU1]